MTLRKPKFYFLILSSRDRKRSYSKFIFCIVRKLAMKKTLKKNTSIYLIEKKKKYSIFQEFDYKRII